MTNRWTLTVTSDVHQLAHIGDFVIQAGRAAGLDERALFAVELACDEACSNIIRHGYAGRPGEIHVTCLVSHSDFVVEVADHGPPFNPLTVKPVPTTRAVNDMSTGGRGVYLIRRLMDTVIYQHDLHGGNRLTMIKHGVVPESTTPGQA